jgi:hypothetical protein
LSTSVQYKHTLNFNQHSSNSIFILFRIF